MSRMGSQGSDLLSTNSSDFISCLWALLLSTHIYLVKSSRLQGVSTPDLPDLGSGSSHELHLKYLQAIHKVFGDAQDSL